MIIGNSTNMLTTISMNAKPVRPIQATQENSQQSTPPYSQPASPATPSYDFTHMSLSELRTTINDMIKKGQLSFDDSTALVTLAIPPMQVNQSEQAPENSNQPINILSSLQTLIDGNKYRGQYKNAQATEKTLKIIELYQANKENNISTT